jgi:hypothetical protein
MGGREYQVFPLSAYIRPSGKIVGAIKGDWAALWECVETQYCLAREEPVCQTPAQQ